MSIEIREKRVKSSDGTHELWGEVCRPAEGDRPQGIVLILHGMTEHMGRYDDLTRTMAEHGYLCCGYDQLGHGRTARDASERGYFSHRNGWRRLVEDASRFADAVREEYGRDLPLILFGYSMGSFVARLAAAVIKPDRLILMGTSGRHPASGIGLLLIRLVGALRGERRVSPWLHGILFGSYQKKGEEPGAWLTTDAQTRRKNAADPLADFKFTTSALYDLVRLQREANRAGRYRTVDKTLPILLISGAEDPVGGRGKGVREVERKLRRAGADVTAHLYEGCRHSLFHEPRKDEVLSDIFAFIEEESLR